MFKTKILGFIIAAVALGLALRMLSNPATSDMRELQPQPDLRTQASNSDDSARSLSRSTSSQSFDPASKSKSPREAVQQAAKSQGAQANRQGGDPSSKIETLFGEPISSRIDRYTDDPRFPLAAHIAIPLEPLINQRVETPISNEDYTAILNDAYLQHAAGSKSIQGQYVSQDASVDVAWTMDVSDVNAESVLTTHEDVHQQLAKRYQLRLYGDVRGEQHSGWLFAEFRTTADGSYQEMTLLDPKGDPLVTRRFYPSSVEDTLNAMARYKDGIDSSTSLFAGTP